MALAFLAGLGIGFCARNAAVGSGTPQQTGARADLASIRKFERAEADATLTQDPSALNTLRSDDAVKRDVPGRPVVGIKAWGERYAEFRVDYPEFKVLNYVPEDQGAVWAGVRGAAEGPYLSRCCRTQEIASAIHAVSSDGVNLEGSIRTILKAAR